MFLGLDLKTKQGTVCRLQHKTNRRATAWDTRQDLATCFTWKQVKLGTTMGGTHGIITEVVSSRS
jgi:hypothetical protein